MTQVKVCGLMRSEDIEAVNAARPDYAGFVLEHPQSRHNVPLRNLRRLVAELNPEIARVGAFVNGPMEVIAGLLSEGVLGAAQLQGTENDEYIGRIRWMTSHGRIWQAIRVERLEDVARAHASRADFVLLDVGLGGARPFDWSLLDAMERPFGLTGGLALENLPEALATNALLADVSDGVETDGLKDPEKIRAFVERVRAEPAR